MQSRILETSQFPTATFELTEPVDFGTEPADLEEITAEATGDLTVHGVTNSVTVDLVARRNGDAIEVTGVRADHLVGPRDQRPQRRPRPGRGQRHDGVRAHLLQDRLKPTPLR